MRTNLVQTLKESAKRFNLNRIAKRVALISLFISLGIGNAWGGGPYYKYQLKTVTQNNTGLGKVYATETNAAPEYSSYYTSKDPAYSAVEASSGTYYLWAVPIQRGVVFEKWTTSSSMTSGGSGGGSTLTNATTMQGASVTVKAPTGASGSDTYTTTATVTAYWKTQNSKVVVTYQSPTDGSYRVTYKYSYLNTSTNKLERGFTFDMEDGATSSNKDSYNNDTITLKILEGTFEGWFSNEARTTALTGITENSDGTYTFVVPASGTSAISVYAKYKHEDKYYGKVTAQIAEESYSMPAGGKISIEIDPDASKTYSEEPQQVSRKTTGASQDYYLSAKPTDKRYVFRGWYRDAACTDLISTSADYTYTFTSTSTNSASPTLGDVYAAFDFNLYYMQVEVEPSTPGWGMVLVKDNNTETPAYTDYASYSEQFLYAYRGAPTANAYLYAKAKYGYKFSGWYDNEACTGSAKSTANPYTYTATGMSTDPLNPNIIKLYAKFEEDATTINVTYNLPDQTKGEYKASVLDIAEVNDEFVWTFTQVYTSEGKTSNTVNAQHKTDVLRLEATPKTGYGVTSWTDGSTTKTTPSSLYETAGTAAKTVGVTFGDAKPFLVRTSATASTGTQYATLAEALSHVSSGNNITVVQNAYVPAGNYAIPNGVTLLIPYDADYTLKTTDPGHPTTALTTPSVYVKLTLGDGVNITVQNGGAISASATSQGGQPYGGCVSGKYGQIEMSAGSTITLNSGANLYCWGYITGEGEITAQSGSKIYEDFQIACWRGGTAASSMINNNKKVFPLAQYYIQNIEAKLHIQAGASEYIWTSVSVSSSPQRPSSAIQLIGSSAGLFQVTSGTLTKWFNSKDDRQMYELEGNMTLSSISITIYVTINSANYVLPLTNNMDIRIKSGTLSCNQKVAILPGAKITIDEGANVSFGASSELYVYDKDDWGKYNYYSGTTIKGVGYFCEANYSPSLSIHGKRLYSNMTDAIMDINGTFTTASGNFYTTNGKANICSSNGTGKVVYSAAPASNTPAAGSKTETYQATQSGSSITYVPIAITPAQLRNGDDSYIATAGSAAGDQFIYSKPQERWLKNPKTITWNANGGTTDAGITAYSDGDFLGALPAAYKDGYTLTGWYTTADGGTQKQPTDKVTANATYYAHWTPCTYTITYKDQGNVAFSGTHVDSPNAHPTTHTFGTATTLNGVNNKTGYTFGGWYRTPSCSGTVVTSIAASECKNITLYAKWIPNTHKLTWNWDGGSTSSTTYTAAGDAVAYNTAIVYPEASTMTKANFVFNGWDKSITTMPDEDLTITAQWEPAVASVTAGSTTTYYTTFVDALTYAKTQATATITILDDITETSTALTYNKASGNCTLDLNGHTVTLTITGAGTSEIKMFNINAASSTFTITDNSTDKDGILKLIASPTTTTQTKRWHGVHLTDGSLVLNAGKVYAEDNFKYTSTSDAGMVSGVTIAAGKTFTMAGGSIDAYCKYTAYGLQVNGSASANATISISGGTIHAETTEQKTAYGIYTLGGTTTISGGTIEAISKTTTAAGIYVQSSKSGYAGKVEMTGGTVNSTSTTTTAYGVLVQVNATGKIPAEFTMSGGTVNVTTGTHTAFGVYVNRAPADAENIYRAIANISGGEIKVTSTTTSSTSGKEVTDGIYSLGTTTITGNPEITVTATKTYARGIRVLDGKTTISGTPTFTVRATQYAYGAAVTGVAPTEAGVCSNAELEINNGTFDVATTSKTYAYGAFVTPVAPTADYTSRSKMTINDGLFTVVAKTTTAIGAYCGRGVLYDQEVLEPHTVEKENLGELNITGGTFNVSTLGTTTADGVRSHGTTNISGGTFNVTPKTTTAVAIRSYAGKTTITGNPHFTVKGTETVYGLWAACEAPNAKTGLTYDGEIECNGGTFDLETKTGATCYGVYAYAGSIKITTLHSTDAAYFAGNYASAGTVVVNDGVFNVTAKTTGAYGVVVPAAVSQSGATGYPTATATAKCDINGGKFLVNGTEKYAVNKKATTANFKISGGYWGGDGVNDNLAYYAVSPNKVLTLRETHALYPDGYRYSVNEGGTVTWKNGSTTLKTEVYESGETPEYTGETPTKPEDASYTYTHIGWDPTIEAMTNADKTYTATFSQTEQKYSVSVLAGANGSVSPASVNNIGCETASGDISATPNAGYQFAGWTLPAGVTAASGYTVNSNPIHIHAIAAGTMTANFAAKTYEVTLDNQSATTAGQTNVTATYNAAMPSIAANLPAKTGYAFGGYYSEVDGGGTLYYNADGTSAHIWDIDAATTLYAKWTQNYIGPELDIVDWTRTSASEGNVRINLNGFPAGGWPYEINGTKYYQNKTKADEAGPNNKYRPDDRTLTISYTGDPDGLFAIVVKKANDEIYSSHTYTIPHINNISGVNENSVVYVNSGTVTVSSNTTVNVNAIYVAPGAELKIAEGATLKAQKLVLRTSEWKAASLDNEGSIDNATKVYYTRQVSDMDYHQFALPLSTTISEVFLSSGASCPYGKTWLLKYYDEESRAINGTTGESNWKVFEGNSTDASAGYELYSGSTFYREFYFPVNLSEATGKTVIVTHHDGAAGDVHAGWNALCSPLLNKYVQDFGDHPEDAIKVSELLEDNRYWQHSPDIIYPAVPFYYQAPGAENEANSSGQLDFSGKELEFKPNNAPRREWHNSVPTQWLRLTVQNTEGKTLDETSIYAHPEKFSVEYETGYDVAKQSLEGGKALLYSELPCGKLAFAAVPDSLAETRIPLTAYAATEGEYVFSMIENNYLGRLQYVLLHDTQTGLVTNLLESDFAANLAQGTNAGRFYIQCVFAAEAPEVSTGVNHLNTENDKAQKIIYNDKVYIIYQGRVYDMTGRQCELR